MNSLIEQIVLGTIQGVAEWLPVSSEGMFILAKTLFFKSQSPLEILIGEALFLHLGSMLAAIIYFRKDLINIFGSLRNLSGGNNPSRPLFNFLFISTFISGIAGLILLKMLSSLVEHHPSSTKLIMLALGLCLLITGILQLIKKEKGIRISGNLKRSDGIILGLAQGFAALPGLSRSGLTVSALLFKNFTAAEAIRISFLMSIPIILVGNIVLNLGSKTFQPVHLAGLAFSFIFSLLTIDILLKAAKKINFGFFVILIAVFVIISAFLPA